MLVYALCEDRNRRAGREIVPRAVIEKPPSAELRPDQKDEDSLPPYAVLDQILEGYVEDDLLDRRARGRRLRPRDRRARDRVSSTASSTSGARRRRACACRRRRSARTGDCRSRTAGPAERHGVRGAPAPVLPGARPRRWRPRCTASRSSSCRTRSTTSRRRRSTCCASASPRVVLAAARRCAADWRGPERRGRPTPCARLRRRRRRARGASASWRT